MAPTSGKAYDRRWWTLVVLSISLLVISLDNTILNVALPTIERDLGASAERPPVDRRLLHARIRRPAADDGQPRRPLRPAPRARRRACCVFGTGSLLSALASGADMLIASRALMGLGGALIMPSTLSILTNVFPAEERPKAIGIWAAVAGLGIAIGPVAGGWLIEQFDWTWVFLVNLPIVVARAGGRAQARARVPRSRAGAARPARRAALHGRARRAHLGDHRGRRSAAGPTRSRSPASAWRWRRSRPSWPGSCAPRSPMLDVRLFRVRRFSGASVSIALVFFSLFGAIFFLTMYLQEVKDYEPPCRRG